ncbi:MAG TPA: FliA/WhiG family RNA polymerase sigma factor [Terriglobia bacterium]|nr:FliA/WhiG family RNA polymerase sigma factor [Terriglobia bacterium]
MYVAEVNRSGRYASPVESRDDLIMAHLPLVKYHAYRLASQLPPNVEVYDLINAGVLGLIDAAGKFDRTRGVQFKTYADMRIRGAMIDSLRELDWAPQALRRQGKKLRATAERLERELGREVGEQEICEEMAIGLEELHELTNHLNNLNVTSLGELGLEEERPMGAQTGDSSDGPHHQLLRQELKNTLTQAIDHLGPRERLVVSLYYFEELTMKEIAAVLEVNESRVSQIHSKAMAQLQRKLKNSGYEPVRNGDRALNKDK